MALIALTRGAVAVVDEEDFAFLTQWKWHLSNGYAVRRDPAENGRSAAVMMHRVINRTPSNMITDHVDGDRLNNRKSNLRDATALQNMMNRAPKKGGTSRHKGVWFDASPRNQRKWRAAIRIGGKLKYLGRFPTQDEAGAAYRAASQQYFGEFHRQTQGAF